MTQRLPPSGVNFLDEWKGVSDAKTRRKLQNRLNQRAHRRRAKDDKPTCKRPNSGPQSLEDAVTKQKESSPPIEFTMLDRLNILGPASERSRAFIRHLETLLEAEFSAGSPRTDLLLGLTRVNILRALTANIDVLGYTAAAMHDDAESPFAIAGPGRGPVRPVTVLPSALQPTPTQLSIAHHPWLDLLPIPKMRDHLIVAGDSIDDAQLCHDMCGNQTPRSGIKGETGIIVWKDPWDPAGWEVTETFLRTWGWAVRDCWELFRSTNRWRAVRGEPPLFRLPA
ncbi:hypothetical protein BJX99DRAFT_226698 [Aspergillus californicus]